jgi:MoxR-like ATPase
MMQQTSATDLRSLQEKIEKESAFVELLNMELGKRIIGQKQMLEKLLVALLADGHILLEGVPGLAKTLAINSLAKACGVDFSRVQFTPDLLPADILGTQIYSPKTETFSIKKGPIFAHFVLADEINRAPAKVQSALLEVMQERQVTLGGETFKLEEPFLVLATQNPIEQEGTYPLPEAQQDRFMLKVVLGYPTREEEKRIVQQQISAEVLPKIQQVVSPAQLLQARQCVREVYLDDKISQYIVDIVYASREPAQYGLPEYAHLISYGASPRASISLALAAKAYAFLKRRGYVIPEDVRALAHDVLRHRLGLSYEAQAEGLRVEDIIEGILNAVQVP